MTSAYATADVSAAARDSGAIAVPRTTYEIFTGSFADSDGDGIGDLNGIREHLDYVNDGDPSTSEDLGADGIWLTPIFKSPTYHKYDAEDYETIDPSFGTMDDFEKLLEACHERGISLYLDLAVNHTSTEHPWFKAAEGYLRNHPGLPEDDLREHPGLAEADFGILDGDGKYVDYYNFSTVEKDGYSQAAGTSYYYEARFWEGMPDLNLDSEAVREEIGEITKFWLDKGVDGFRLDAVTSYYTGDKEKSIDFLRWLTGVIKSQRSDAYVVGECWADEQTIADYYDSGIDSLFDFPFAGQDGIIASAVRSGQGVDRWAEAMAEEEETFSSHNPDFINAPFYTNHDMARSAGYYSYDDGTKAKLAGGMNLLMGGNAFVYYGEEVGLKGSGKDENKRAPMPWSEAEAGESLFAASSVTEGPEGMDKAELKYGTVEEQASDPDSILSYYRKAIRLRAAYPAIAEGKTTVIGTLTGKSLAVFTKAADTQEPVLVAVNIGSQAAEIDLSEDETAEGFTNLAELLRAQSAESARNAASGGGTGRRRRRRKTETEAETRNSQEVRADEGGLAGSVLTVPAYGIAVLTED